jgi:hypothetical protein
MNRLNRMAAAARCGAARLLPAGRRDWAAAVCDNHQLAEPGSRKTYGSCVSRPGDGHRLAMNGGEGTQAGVDVVCRAENICQVRHGRAARQITRRG